MDICLKTGIDITDYAQKDIYIEESSQHSQLITPPMKEGFRPPRGPSVGWCTNTSR